MRRAAVGQIIAIDGGQHHVVQPHELDGARGVLAAPRASSQPCGLPVSTAQKRQARVHTAPISMMVAVPAFQHSPMFGHFASSHTVASRCSLHERAHRPEARTRGARALSHAGLARAGRRRQPAAP